MFKPKFKIGDKVIINHNLLKYLNINLGDVGIIKEYDGQYPKVLFIKQNKLEHCFEHELTKELDISKVVYQTKYEREENKNICLHNFKNYIGFKEIYEYCIKCDVKKGT